MSNENSKRKWLTDKMLAVVPNSTARKIHQNAMSGGGVPDQFLSARGLGGVWLEFKYCRKTIFDWAKEPTKLQKSTLREFWLAGCNVGVVVYFEYDETWASVHNDAMIRAFDSMDKYHAADIRWGRCQERFFVTQLLWGRATF